MPHKIAEDHFGKTKDGKDVSRFTFSNNNNVKISVINYGGYITSIIVPDRKGQLNDIGLGYDKIEEYEDDNFYLSSIVGRYANRINKGKFKLEEEEYQLNINNGPNHLHGGMVGFNKKVWEAQIEDDHMLVLSYTSPDGEENYPGALSVTARYELTDDNHFNMTYTATTTKPTIVNLTQHTYFNLSGHDSGDVCSHLLALHGDKFTPKDDTGIPLGEMAPVSGTVFDFRKPSLLGKHITEVPGDVGYDHSFCVNENSKTEVCARVEDPESGRILELLTNQPSVHLYTGYYLDCKGKEGATYKKYSGFCLEQQNFPDAINQPNFPSPILRPGTEYKHTCSYIFSVKK